MSSDKPNFLSQPVVKNVFMFRNGDPYYEARRIVINQKRVSNFETLLREVTGGVQAPFGAVRNIYTPRGGHKVDCLESLQSGEQYVAAGRERFKKLDYLQIGSRRRRMLQTLPVPDPSLSLRVTVGYQVLLDRICRAHPLQPLHLRGLARDLCLAVEMRDRRLFQCSKPAPQNRIIVSARFLKPIKEPCTIFVVANGDLLNPAVRLLIHQRMLGQFDRILEMITEKMGLKVLGGVRSLYTYEGHQVTDGDHLESGQLYVAVGREKFKKLSYSDLLFTKPKGARRVNGMKAYSLPPIYRFSKHNGNSKSVARGSDSGSGESKASPPGQSVNNKEHLSSIVREISQARLISLRKKRSGQSMTLTISDNDDQESKADNGTTDDKGPQEQPAEEKPACDGASGAEEKDEKAAEQEEPENTKAEETPACEANNAENQETNGEKEDGGEKKENDEASNGKGGEETEVEENEESNNENKAKEPEEVNEEPDNEKDTAGPGEKEDEEIKEEVKEEVADERREEVKDEEQGSGGSNSDKSQDSGEKEDGGRISSEGEKDEQGKHAAGEEGPDKDSGSGEDSSMDDPDPEREQKETEKSSDPGKTRSDNETKDDDSDTSSGNGSNRGDDLGETKGGAARESGEEERKGSGEVSGEDDEVESEAEQDGKDKTGSGGKDEGGDEEVKDVGRKEKE